MQRLRLSRVVNHLQIPLLTRAFSAGNEDFIQARLLAQGCGSIHLNRPKSLNALNLDMVQSILATLKQWEKDPNVKFILFTGSGDKSFCAGGDVIALAQIKVQDPAVPQNFFRTEYTMNHLIARYPKPVVSVIKGIVMGGGVGISLNGAYRVLTDSTKFAMPETGIGLFPDVGASFFLPRLKGGPALGMYFALTGNAFGLADSMYAGVGTHYVPAEKLPDLVSALEVASDPAPVLDAFKQTPPPSELAALAPTIDSVFDPDSALRVVTTKLEALQAVPDERESAFATKSLETLASKSPTSLAISFQNLHEGQHRTLAEVLQNDLRVGVRIAQKGAEGDFYKGVNTQLVLKERGTTKWNPAPSIKELAHYFAPFSEDENVRELDVDSDPILV